MQTEEKSYFFLSFLKEKVTHGKAHKILRASAIEAFVGLVYFVMRMVAKPSEWKGLWASLQGQEEGGEEGIGRRTCVDGSPDGGG